MNNLYEPATVESMRARVARISTGGQKQWGKMTAAQAMAHCAVGFEMALGEQKAPRMLLGRLFGGIAKRSALNEKPLPKNSPTSPAFIITGDRDLPRECERLSVLIARFAAAGPAGCTTHPHAFFGPLTPREWAILMYKHTDHHLRQFGA